MTSQTFSWLLGLISGIFFIKGVFRSANFKIKTYQILIIFMLSGRSSLCMTGPRTLIILNNFSLAKFNLSLSFVIQINVTFVFGVLYKKYTLFLFLRVSPRTLLLSANSFIFLLKKVKSCQSSSCNLWILVPILRTFLFL